jgi:hypothetical protein
MKIDLPTIMSLGVALGCADEIQGVLTGKDEETIAREKAEYMYGKEPAHD